MIDKCESEYIVILISKGCVSFRILLEGLCPGVLFPATDDKTIVVECRLPFSYHEKSRYSEKNLSHSNGHQDSLSYSKHKLNKLYILPVEIIDSTLTSLF